MRITAEAFAVGKAGNAADEYEDAAWPPRAVSTTAARFRAAVADGATETSFSGLWARLLVQAYRLGYFDRHPLPTGLTGLQQRWRTATGGKPLPWYAEQKRDAGAFAALIGLTLADGTDGDHDGSWTATAVGDACLFQIRDDRLIAAFPMTESEQFNSRPLLISTAPASNAPLLGGVSTTSGHWRVGDAFYLMSDALACWFLRRWELRADPLEFLRQIADPGGFAEFVALQRDDPCAGLPAMKNDDVTWVRCRLA